MVRRRHQPGNRLARRVGARAALMPATELDPNYTLAGGQRALLTDPAFAERYLRGLRMAEFD